MLAYVWVSCLKRDAIKREAVLSYLRDEGLDCRSKVIRTGPANHDQILLYVAVPKKGRARFLRRTNYLVRHGFVLANLELNGIGINPTYVAV